jgi:hypothetical protein
MASATTSPTASESTSIRIIDQFVLSEVDRSRLQTYVHLGRESARARIRSATLFPWWPWRSNKLQGLRRT